MRKRLPLRLHLLAGDAVMLPLMSTHPAWTTLGGACTNSPYSWRSGGGDPAV